MNNNTFEQCSQESTAVPSSVVSQTPSPRVLTGVAGLDEVLCGGLLPQRAYLLRGGPGSGKTTLGMHFLVAGAALGECCLCITLGESAQEMRLNARQCGLNVDTIHFLDLSPSVNSFTQKQSYALFSPDEVERETITQQLLEQFETLKPQRVFLDAMTQFRFLAIDPFQFRTQVLSFLRYLVGQVSATVLFTSEGSDAHPDDDLQFLSDGIISLDFIRQRRSVSISKFRGSDFRSEIHEMRLTESGMEVFPHLLPGVSQPLPARETISSGLPELDELLHGGLERGTITMLTGPTGVGKTTLGLHFIKDAAERGEHSVIYIFEEMKEALAKRCEAVSIPIHAMLASGVLSMIQVEPLSYTADEFANLMRREVEAHHPAIVMIDGTSGYRLSLRGDDLISHLHALCKYLQNMGVAVLLINEVEAITGELRVTEISISYLADTIIFLRYQQLKGRLHKYIGILKKRLSDFEKTQHEYEITRDGIRIGKQLSQRDAPLVDRNEPTNTNPFISTCVSTCVHCVHWYKFYRARLASRLMRSSN